MALYEFFCPKCQSRFEERRPMSAATKPARCGKGHRAERVLSMFAVSRGGVSVEDEAPAVASCACGGNCACGA
ncbi:MAG TPA: FmdB family zinc ribbon protein [Dehalococcoidia bacterium]|nr:FmdB family zinc ribbon protein [Dehalococcoidia bacterium]